jgi:hypothetical protein
MLVLLTGVLALHLLEEVRAGFRRSFPLGEMPRPVFVGINVGIYLYASIMVALSAAGRPAWVPMAWLFAVAVAVNGVAHLGIMALRRASFPGGVTAALLIVVALAVISRLPRL